MRNIVNKLVSLAIVAFGGAVLVGFIEFELVRRIGSLRAGHVRAESEAPEWIQQLSRDVAKSLDLAPLRVIDAAGDEIYAHADLDTDPPRILMNVKAFKQTESDLAKSVIAHEYGHLDRERKGKATKLFLYFFGTYLFLTMALWSHWQIARNLRHTGGLVAISAVAGLWIGTNKYSPFLASTLLAIMVAFLPLLILDKHGKKRHMAALVAGLVLYAVGVEVRNHYFRADEMYSDDIAKKVTGDVAVRRMLCALDADHNRSAAVGWTPYVTYQEWEDTHPRTAQRAKAVGVELNCKNLQTVPVPQ